MVNALQGGELDAASDLPAAQVKLVEAAGFQTVTSETGKWNYIFLEHGRSSRGRDVRVRQAMRLIMDRQQMVDLALEGYGRVGNDMWGIFDPAYPTDFPQRAQDIEQAKSLLKQAGYDDLKFELLTSQVGTGDVRGRQVFAEQAKQAGVTVTVKKIDVGAFWGDKYLTWPNGPGWYSARMYLSQARLCCRSWNEPHWDGQDLLEAASTRRTQTVDDAERNEMHPRGCTRSTTTSAPGTSGRGRTWSTPAPTKVHGLVPDASGIPFNVGLRQPSSGWPERAIVVPSIAAG